MILIRNIGKRIRFDSRYQDHQAGDRAYRGGDPGFMIPDTGHP